MGENVADARQENVNESYLILRFDLRPAKWLLELDKESEP